MFEWLCDFDSIGLSRTRNRIHDKAPFCLRLLQAMNQLVVLQSSPRYARTDVRGVQPPQQRLDHLQAVVPTDDRCLVLSRRHPARRIPELHLPPVTMDGVVKILVTMALIGNPTCR